MFGLDQFQTVKQFQPLDFTSISCAIFFVLLIFRLFGMGHEMLRVAEKFYSQLKKNSSDICSLCKVDCTTNYHENNKQKQVLAIVTLLREKNIPAYAIIGSWNVWFAYPGKPLAFMVLDTYVPKEAATQFERWYAEKLKSDDPLLPG